MSGLESAISEVFLGLPSGTDDEAALRALVHDVSVLGALGVPEKLREFKGAAQSGKLSSLNTELAFARFVARSLHTRPTLHVGDAPDLSFKLDNTLCLADAVHKSAPTPFLDVFNPTPDMLAQYTNKIAWQAASLRLHAVLRHVPVAIQPYLGKEFLEQRVGWQARSRQEASCGALAEWLANELAGAVARGDRALLFTDGVTHFELEPLATPPGWIRGYGGVEAWIAIDGTLRDSIDLKAQKAGQRLVSMGADCYLIFLSVEDAAAAYGGTDLLTTLLGPLTSDGSSRYRPVPASARADVESAMRGQRRELLHAAHFDPSHALPPGWRLPAYFDPGLREVGAIIAQYYDGGVHFVPNPFTTNALDELLRRLPADFAPFTPDDIGRH